VKEQVAAAKERFLK